MSDRGGGASSGFASRGEKADLAEELPVMGVEELDRQHRVFHMRWRAVSDAYRKGDLRSLRANLWFVDRHGKEHFASEEHHMREVGYPNLGLAPTQRSAARTTRRGAYHRRMVRPLSFRGLGAGTRSAVAMSVTAPRRIVPDSTYLVSRRCTQRDFLLKPSVLTNLIFKFVLAVAAARYGVLVHAVCVMSNHFHLVVTDPRANLPEFSRLLDGVVAKALNALYGRWENFWAPCSYSAVALVSPDDIVEKVAYTLANPAIAGLVEHGSQWPGIWSDPRLIGRPGERIERPGHYFAKDGSMPDSSELVFSAPPGFESIEEFQAQVIARVKELEKTAAAEREANGVAVLGARRVLKQKHTERPAPGEPRRVLNPRIAGQDRWKRIEALGRMVDFLARHRDALVKFWRGERDVVFPPGTYLMRIRFGVSCASS